MVTVTLLLVVVRSRDNDVITAEVGDTVAESSVYSGRRLPGYNVSFRFTLLSSLMFLILMTNSMILSILYTASSSRP